MPSRSSPVVIQGDVGNKNHVLQREEGGFVPRVIRDEKRNGRCWARNGKRPHHSPVLQRELPPVMDPKSCKTNKNMVPTSDVGISTTIGVNTNGMGYTSVNSSGTRCCLRDPNHGDPDDQTLARVRFQRKFSIKTEAGRGSVLNFSNITGVQGAGDPIILYDQLAKCWLLTEFGYSAE